MKTLSGEEETPWHGHAGLPFNGADALFRMSKGLPVYCPTMPSTIDQRPFWKFAEERGENSR